MYTTWFREHGFGMKAAFTGGINLGKIGIKTGNKQHIKKIG
jgi:hypothetical protein